MHIEPSKLHGCVGVDVLEDVSVNFVLIPMDKTKLFTFFVSQQVAPEQPYLEYYS